MTVHYFRGDAVAVAVVRTVTITAYDAATTYKLTRNGRTVSCVGTTNATLTAAALAAAWNASTELVHAELTAANNSSATVTLTADTAGISIGPITSSVSGGTGTIGSVTETVSAQGPNVLCLANLSPGTMPVNGDTLDLTDNTVDILYGLDLLASVGMVFFSRADNTAKVGLPLVNAAGYVEDRPTDLELAYITNGIIGDGNGNGSPRLQLKVGTGTISTITVLKTSSTSEDGNYAPVQIVGGHSTSVLNVFGGKVDIAPHIGDSASFTSVNCSGGTVRIFEDVTLVNVIASGSGVVENRVNATLMQTLDAGTLKTIGSANATTLKVHGGDVTYDAAGTITTLDIAAGKRLDASNNTGGITVTNATVRKDCVIDDPAGKITWSNAISVQGCGLHEFEHTTKPGLSYLLS